MGEMTHAFAMLKNLPSNQIMKNPAGTFSFVGRVNSELGYERKDGTPLTVFDIHDITQFGPGFVRHIKVRVYKTREDAEKALALIS